MTFSFPTSASRLAALKLSLSHKSPLSNFDLSTAYRATEVSRPSQAVIPFPGQDAIFMMLQKQRQSSVLNQIAEGQSAHAVAGASCRERAVSNTGGV